MLCAACSAWAQWANTDTIAGTVTDSSKAVVNDGRAVVRATTPESGFASRGGSYVVVAVSASGDDLQTMNATAGNIITSTALDALPSIGRDVSTLAELQPGAAPEGSVAGTVN